MSDLLNAFACAVMLCLCFPVAVVMHSRGFWAQRLIFSLAVILLGFQVVAPLYPAFPNANWLQASVNLLLMLTVFLARRQIMSVVRLTLAENPQEKEHPTRRAQDLAPALYSRVHGRGAEQTWQR